MKSTSFRMFVALMVLAAFSGSSVAGPDFYMIERGRLAKQAEAQKVQADGKKCFDDSKGAPVTNR